MALFFSSLVEEKLEGVCLSCLAFVDQWMPDGGQDQGSEDGVCVNCKEHKYTRER